MRSTDKCFAAERRDLQTILGHCLLGRFSLLCQRALRTNKRFHLEHNASALPGSSSRQAVSWVVNGWRKS
jgi:hypothetical protein